MLADWLQRWMEREVMPNNERTTAYAYGNIVKNHLVPALGRVKLSQITPDLLEEYYHWLGKERGLSSNTIRKHHILLHTSLQAACRLGLLRSNPVDLAVPPRFETGSASYYNPEQLGTLLQMVTGHALELPVRLACSLGLRRGEILGLRWRDVDLEEGILTIRRTRTTMGSVVVEKAPKTVVSCRTLSIAALEDLMELLQLLREERKERGIPCGENDLLVLDTMDRPWHPNVLTTTFSNFVVKHGLPSVTLHGLRHSFASVASNARVPMYQISRAMGHSSPATTQRVYTHLFEPTHGEVLAAVAAAIPDGKGKTRKKTARSAK
jgi:integrase